MIALLLSLQLLSTELQTMCAKDQDARGKFLSGDVTWDQVALVDRENLPKLKKIIAEHGWPALDEAGGESLWLLVQHCDEDLVFQKECLELLKAAAKHQKAPLHHVAYLTDRILKNEGKNQLYGTQFLIQKEALSPYPIENPEELDCRRQEMGLEPYEDYMRTSKAMFLPSTPQ